MWNTGRYTSIKRLIQRLHQDQAGDIPVGTILIIGLVIIPLVLILVIFRVELWTGLIDAYTKVHDAQNKIKF